MMRLGLRQRCVYQRRGSVAHLPETARAIGDHKLGNSTKACALVAWMPSSNGKIIQVVK